MFTGWDITYANHSLETYCVSFRYGWALKLETIGSKLSNSFSSPFFFLLIHTSKSKYFDFIKNKDPQLILCYEINWWFSFNFLLLDFFAAVCSVVSNFYHSYVKDERFTVNLERFHSFNQACFIKKLL